MAGIGCPADGSHGVSIVGNGSGSGWLDFSAGGWAANGCDGHTTSMPMNGEANTYDNVNYVNWWFHTGPVTSGTCSVSVFVPSDNGKSYTVDGAPAYYEVWDKGTDLGGFAVNQAGSRGHWTHYSGSFRVRDGDLSVHLVDRGIDYHTTPNAMLGAAQVQVSCTASGG